MTKGKRGQRQRGREDGRKKKGNNEFPLTELSNPSQQVLCGISPHRKEADPLVDILSVSTECSSPKYFILSQFCSVISTVSSTLQKMTQKENKLTFSQRSKEQESSYQTPVLYPALGPFCICVSSCLFPILKPITFANLSYKLKQRCNIPGFSRVISKALISQVSSRNRAYKSMIILSPSWIWHSHRNPAPKASSREYM